MCNKNDVLWSILRIYVYYSLCIFIFFSLRFCTIFLFFQFLSCWNRFLYSFVIIIIIYTNEILFCFFFSSTHVTVHRPEPFQCTLLYDVETFYILFCSVNRIFFFFHSLSSNEVMICWMDGWCWLQWKKIWKLLNIHFRWLIDVLW